MDAWTFTIPMSVIWGSGSTLATISGGLFARQWWKGHAIRVEAARYKAVKDREARNELYCQKELEAKQEKEAEAKLQRRADMPVSWRTLFVTLTNMSMALQLVYFQQCMADKRYPKISVVGADHFTRYFALHSKKRRDAAAEAMGPHLDIGVRLSDTRTDSSEYGMNQKWDGWLDKSIGKKASGPRSNDGL